jgi:ketosteroid isomerase-like protein
VTVEANIASAQRFLEALRVEAWSTACAEATTDVEIYDQDIALDAEHFSGHEGVRQWVETWNESWDSWRIDELEFETAGEDHLLALFTMFVTGMGSGIELSRPDAITYRFEDGKIRALAYYNDQDQARAAFAAAMGDTPG